MSGGVFSLATGRNTLDVIRPSLTYIQHDGLQPYFHSAVLCAHGQVDDALCSVASLLLLLSHILAHPVQTVCDVVVEAPTVPVCRIQ